MAKLTLDDIGTDSFQSIDRYNANQALIEAALENTLSRDGTSPNTMSANLDLNDNRIINVATPTNAADAATKGYVDETVNVIIAGSLPDSADYIAADAAVTASLTSSITIVADELDALATTVTALTASTTTADATLTAAVSTEATARTSADTALSARLDVVEASVEDPNTALVALVNSHTTAIADLETNSATAADLTTLTARVTTTEGDITTAEAAITSEATARATADGALSTRLDSVEASLGTPSAEFSARVETLESAVVDLESGKAEASALTTLNSTVNGLSSTVTTQGTTITGIDGKLTASYGLTVDGNGRIASMKLLSNGATSTVAFTADSFKIFNGTSNQSVFTAEEGSVKINGDLVVNGTISTGALADVGGVVATGLLTNYYEQSGDPGAVANGSLWFKTGTNELFIRRSGSWGKIADISAASTTFTISYSASPVNDTGSGTGFVTSTVNINTSNGTPAYSYFHEIVTSNTLLPKTSLVGASSGSFYLLGSSFSVSESESGLIRSTVVDSTGKSAILLTPYSMTRTS